MPGRFYVGLGSKPLRNTLLTVGVAALAVDCVYLALVPPVGGYETSLITAYPLAFWLAFAVGLAVVITTLVASAATDGSRWLPAFGLLAVFYGIFFFLPLHRGYQLYDRGSSDALGHLGIVKATLARESLPGVFYPVEHLIISELSMVGISPSTSRYLLPFVFTMLFIASVGLLVRSFVGRRAAIGAGLAAATPLVFANFQVRIHPFFLSTLLLPLILFLFERTRRVNDWRFRLSYVVLGFAVLFFHPVTAVFLVLMVSTFVLWTVYSRTTGDALPVPTTRLTSLLGLVAIWWYISFGRTRRALAQVLSSNSQVSIVVDQASRAQSAGLSPPQLVVRFVQKYGVVFIVLAIGGIYTLVVLDRVRRREAAYPDAYATLQYVIGGAITVVFLIVYLLAFDPIRVARYQILAAVLLCGLVLAATSASMRSGNESRRLSGRTLACVVVTLCLVAAAFLGTFAGTTYWPNEHMTRAEYQGAEFVLSHNDPDVRVRALSLHTKMQWYVTGSRSEPGEPPVFQPGSGYGLPPRLGYDENRTAAQTFGRAHVVTQAYDTAYHGSSYYTPEQRRALFVYGENALRRLGNDTTADRIYANGGFTVWNVNRSGGS
jgi:hypothetical protein